MFSFIPKWSRFLLQQDVYHNIFRLMMSSRTVNTSDKTPGKEKLYNKKQNEDEKQMSY